MVTFNKKVFLSILLIATASSCSVYAMRRRMGGGVRYREVRQEKLKLRMQQRKLVDLRRSIANVMEKISEMQIAVSRLSEGRSVETISEVVQLQKKAIRLVKSLLFMERLGWLDQLLVFESKGLGPENPYDWSEYSKLLEDSQEMLRRIQRRLLRYTSESLEELVSIGDSIDEAPEESEGEESGEEEDGGEEEIAVPRQISTDDFQNVCCGVM